jgi:hypothetical protein
LNSLNRTTQHIDEPASLKHDFIMSWLAEIEKATLPTQKQDLMQFFNMHLHIGYAGLSKSCRFLRAQVQSWVAEDELGLQLLTCVD